MPDLVGVIGSGEPGANATLAARMVESLSERRACSTGAHECESLGLALAWTSDALEPIEPVWNEARDIFLVLCGELCGDGAAAALAHYERNAAAFGAALNGRFSAVIVDLRRRRVVMLNDRYGFQRLYIHQAAGRLCFASEAKALLRALPATRAINYHSLGELLACGCVLQDRTLFRGIDLFPAGSRWTWDGIDWRKARYFMPTEWESQDALDVEDYYRALRETFPRVLLRHLRGPHRIGMSLTGGLDGRMIMAWADAAPGELPCYTFASAYRECADVRIARRVAAASGQRHEVIVLGDAFLREFADLARRTVYQSDGTMDVTGAAEMHVNRVARAIAPVRLTGTYGSEILRGVVGFKPQALHNGCFAPEFVRELEGAATTYAEERRCHPLSFIAFKQVPWYHYGRSSIERSQLALRLPYLDNELVALAYRAPVAERLSSAPSLRLIAEGNPDLARIPTDRGLVQQTRMLTPLHHAWQQLTFKAEYAYDEGMPHWLTRIDRVLSPLHPERLFLGRHKFQHFRIWYRRALADTIRQMLLDPRSLSRPWVDAGAVTALFHDHLSGRENRTAELHTRLLTAELIQRRADRGHRRVPRLRRHGCGEVEHSPHEVDAPISARAAHTSACAGV